MQLRDRDLISIQEARELAAAAAAAQQKFSHLSQEQVDAVVEAVAKAALTASESLARLAVEETGYGNVPDKIIKNSVAAVDVPRAIRGMKTVGIIHEDQEKKILDVAVPVGVVCAIIPCTNPTSTAIYKTIISLKARNAIVLSPHPSAIRCICQTAKTLARAAASTGAPEGIITCMERNTLAGTQELMRAPEVGIILATGGTGLVRAAYGSGKPAYGVGPGNVPAFIERTADVRKAVADIFAGKTFDYGTICSSEQAMVVEESVREAALEECRKQGGYFLSDDEIKRVGAFLFPGGGHVADPKLVGRHATHIAELAGIKVPLETRVLIARLDAVGRSVPLSAEKLSPVLAFYSVANLEAGINRCVELLRFGGLGHTCSIHSQDTKAVREFGQRVPAFRVVVNTASVHGSIGYSTNLFPALTLGCGALGGNITSDNIGPRHLMNIRRIAWESRPVEHRTVPSAQRLDGPSGAHSAAAAAAAGAVATSAAPGSSPATTAALKSSSPPAHTQVPADTSSPDRAMIAHAVEHVMTHLGIPRGAAAASGQKGEGARAALSPDSSASSAEKTAPPRSAAPVKPSEPAVLQFVSEGDVRRAVTRGEKILIGPKTILTPSARDVAGSEEVLVMTTVVPSKPTASASE
ncbi:MAG TPA: aldehyde dehydrogenase family protein [Candidatus Acidoferrum sp.]|nr:aldehyde dehydrogenase family protein [Candidatus Acidoferrum sp.]